VIRVNNAGHRKSENYLSCKKAQSYRFEEWNQTDTMHLRTGHASLSTVHACHAIRTLLSDYRYEPPHECDRLSTEILLYLALQVATDRSLT
jgi:hypothetical protein